MEARADHPEPISLELAKAHCRIDISDEDPLLEQVYIPAARQTAEQYTGCTIKQVDVIDPLVWDGSLFADDTGVRLASFPAFDLSAVVAIDHNGNETDIDLDEYSARIVNRATYAVLQTGRALPSFNTLRVSYTAGWPDGQVPPNLILAMLLLTGDAYENREAQQAGVVLQRNQRAVALMDPFRITFGI
jgi:uncharacterized phiE125 gp8 family phage protein